jgi:hypothetical protein
MKLNNFHLLSLDKWQYNSQKSLIKDRKNNGPHNTAQKIKDCKYETSLVKCIWANKHR